VLVDVTHFVPAQDMQAGSVVLERAIAAFPRGTIHLAVVDPGVGTDRRILIVSLNRQTIVCPDNGLITWAWRMHEGGRANVLTWKPGQMSATFHGRDILAPVAGRLANGATIQSLAKPVRDSDLLPAIANALRVSSQALSSRIELDCIHRRMARLTPREREVLALLVEGRLNKQVACELGVAEKTIKVHRARVMEKMEAHSLVDLVRVIDKVHIPLSPGQSA